MSTILLALVSGVASAESVGEFAEQLTGPVLHIGSLIRGICIVSGIAMIVMSLIRFRERKSGVHVSFGTIFFLGLAGVGLILLGIFLGPETVAKYFRRQS